MGDDDTLDTRASDAGVSIALRGAVRADVSGDYAANDTLIGVEHVRGYC